MKTSLQVCFPGSCREAFAFYEKTFRSKIQMTMSYGEAPAGMSVPEESKNLVMHTAMPLGNVQLMGCDLPKGREQALGGFQVCVEAPEEAEVRRIFGELSKGGSVQMPLAPTFWSPLFGMCTDRYGVAWMLTLPVPAAQG